MQPSKQTNFPDLTDDQILAQVIASVPAAVLERVGPSRFRFLGRIPRFASALFGDNGVPLDRNFTGELHLEDQPFLENFLIDAEEFWAQSQRGMLRSGIWQEPSWAGHESFDPSRLPKDGQSSEAVPQHVGSFEAGALFLPPNRKLLLIQGLDATFGFLQGLFQGARESSLKHQALQREMQSKEELLLCILHDLKSPLATIVSGLSILKGQAISEEDKLQLVERGLSQARRQTGMIRTLVGVFSEELAELQAFNKDSLRAPDLRMAAANVADLMSPAFRSRQVQLDAPSLNDSSRHWKVVGQYDRLERLINNLIDNALRYSPEGGTVRIELQRDAKHHLLRIIDQGPGVDPEKVEGIFSKFQQESARPGMAGLGLYYCRSTAERWGGSVGYEPAPEGGSIFWVRLLAVD